MPSYFGVLLLPSSLVAYTARHSISLCLDQIELVLAGSSLVVVEFIETRYES